jgi:hypothetical protein
MIFLSFSEMPFSDMKVLVTNNSYGSPIIWEYDEGEVERMDLIDFNTHIMLIDQGPELGWLPLDLYEIIINQVMADRLATRNFGLAFELLTINRRTLFMFYYQIYGSKTVSTRVMLAQLSRTFELGEAFYEQYLAAPNPTSSGLNAVSLTRLGSLRYNPKFEPWDFMPVADIQRVTVSDEDSLEGIHIFPGQFHGDTVWIHGEEDNGIYNVKKLHHPVFLIILCDFTYALIPTRQTINNNWYKFCEFMRQAFGPNTGFYFMVKHQQDVQNPFIETTELFVQI